MLSQQDGLIAFKLASSQDRDAIGNWAADLDERAFVVMTQYGKPFSPKALGGRMQDWTKAAGIPPGYTLHGLRKTLGKTLAEGKAATRQMIFGAP